MTQHGEGRAEERREAGLRELSESLRRGGISRREFLRRAATLGVVGGAATALLAACTGESPPISQQARQQAPEDTVATERSGTGPESGSENPRVGYVMSHELYGTQDLVEYGVAAEEAGFDMVWASDHFQPWMDNEGHSMYPWLTLSLLGEQTSRVLFGSGVTCPIYRYQPAQVAQAFASMALFDPGRIFLGVGTGEALNEAAATGSFGPYEERAARLVEAVELIKELWTGEWTSFAGDYYETNSARLYDVPEEPIPLYIAASGPKSARIAGQYGDGWIARAPDIQRQDLLDAFREGAEEAGKDPETMPKLVVTSAVVGDQEEIEYAANVWRYSVDPWSNQLLYEPDPREVQRKAEETFSLEEVYQNWPTVEDPETHVSALQNLFDAGATRVFIQSPQRDQRRLIDFYGSEVLPQLRSGGS